MQTRHGFIPGVEAVERRALLAAPPSAVAAEDSSAFAAYVAGFAADTPPVILQAVEVIQARRVVAFQITFTKPVDPAPLADLGHYALFDLAPHVPRGRSVVPLASATVDAAGQTLTLIPASPAPVAPYVLTSPGPGDRSTSFIADAQGRPLVTPFRNFTVFFQSRGTSLLDFALTSSPEVNSLTGAGFAVHALASIRGAQNTINSIQNFEIIHGSLSGAAGLLWLAARL